MEKLDLSQNDILSVLSMEGKKRFELDKDHLKIRACQGHTLPGVMAVDLAPVEPPKTLFHGTTRKALEGIHHDFCIKRMSRHHVHLTGDVEVAWENARRRREQTPVVIVVLAGEMYKNGYDFFRANNGVWLTDYVPDSYIYELE
jgi:putative RNA 2'-phosphotransferase